MTRPVGRCEQIGFLTREVRSELGTGLQPPRHLTDVEPVNMSTSQSLWSRPNASGWLTVPVMETVSGKQRHRQGVRSRGGREREGPRACG